MEESFSGIGRLYGQKASVAFANSHICVIGIGGVGTWAAEALVRTGFGTITLIDLDDVCITNINRQSVALRSTIGQSKVEVMAQRLLDINPDLICHKIDDFITLENINTYVKDFDFVLDCIDNAKLKAHLINHCKRNKIKIITIGGAGGKKDPTLISISDLTKSYQDPLLAKVRSTLRSNYNYSKTKKFGIYAVFSSEPLSYPSGNGEISCAKPESGVKGGCFSGFGSVTMVTASFAFVAVAKIAALIMDKANNSNI